MAGLRQIGLPALKVLRYIQTHDYAHIRALKLHPALHDEIERLLQGYISYLLERRLQSASFIKRLRLESGL